MYVSEIKPKGMTTRRDMPGDITMDSRKLRNSWRRRIKRMNNDPTPQTTPEVRRLCIAYLKKKFTGWRDPAVELPAESVIEDVVSYIISIARSSREAPDV
jgi:hypothetical protein